MKKKRKRDVRPCVSAKEKNTRKFYDESFLEIFTNRKIVKSMLEDFVAEDWVKLIDFSTMKAKISVFKGISDSKKESDLLLEFKIKKDETKCSAAQVVNQVESLYIFIFLEFQSTSKAIILRLFEYLARIYKKQRKKNRILFPVVPIVVYNGKKNWTEKNTFKDHFFIYTDEIGKYIPDFEYILIDINCYDDDMLEDLKDAVSCFFLLDKTNLKERDKAAERIIRILKILKDADKETFNLLGRYITGLLKYKGVEINSINEYINDGGKSMLAQSLDELFEQGIEQGIEQGGLLDKQEVLIRQAEKKFGLSEEGRKLIKSVTDSRKLDDALDIILFAGNPEEVLNCLKY